ncbi:malectin-like isoform X2 [Bolinopsis microptera]|uniref:malectin-like isoform X2 n=1 Tax=Bolinopsis microptera TaxID=2820187 RepID=UPI0030793F1B
MLYLLLSWLLVRGSDGARAIWALNAGGGSHRGVDGVMYKPDISDMPGVASDHGVTHVPLLARVHPQDRILYQTERYYHDSFGYDIPISKNGNYVLNLKFSEVYFRSPNQKVFDIKMNNQPVIVGLDIFNKVGFGTAHDEYVPFKIHESSLLIGDYKLAFDGNLHVEFVKTPYDNPKVNALVLYEGTLNDVPRLPAIQNEDEDIVQEDIIQEDPAKPDMHKERRAPEPAQQKKVSRPKKANPYDDQSAQYWPIIISIGVFLPTVILLYTRQKAS